MVIAAAATAADADGSGMIREDAEREAARRNREETAALHRWLACPHADDEWSLVKVVGLPGARASVEGDHSMVSAHARVARRDAEGRNDD